MGNSLVVFLTIGICLSALYEFKWTKVAHRTCADWVRTSSPNRDLNLAMLCGENSLNQSRVGKFKDLGIYHLVVVSGFHLQLLWSALTYFLGRLNLPIQAISGLAISFVAGFQIPISRSLVQSLLNRWQSEQRLFWRPHFVVLIIHFLFCLVKPDLFLSISLMLSSLASSCLLVAKSPLKLALAMYFTSLPVMVVLGAPSASSILINALLAFPLSVLMIFGALASTVFLDESIWTLFNWLVDSLWQVVPSSQGAFPTPVFLVVIYSLAILFLRALGELHRLPKIPFYLYPSIGQSGNSSR